MTKYEGCSDGNCLLRITPLQQHTNGGCRCLRDVPLPLRLAIQRKLWSQKDEIERLTRELEGVNTSVCHRCGKKVFVIQNNVVCQCATGGE